MTRTEKNRKDKRKLKLVENYRWWSKISDTMKVQVVLDLFPAPPKMRYTIYGECYPCGQ